MAMVDPDTLAERIARAKALLTLSRETRAAARNQRHVAVLRRALNRLVRPTPPAQALSKPDEQSSPGDPGVSPK